MINLNLSYTRNPLWNFLIFPLRLIGKGFFMVRFTSYICRAPHYIWVFTFADGTTERRVAPSTLIVLSYIQDRNLNITGISCDPLEGETKEDKTKITFYDESE